MNKENVQGLILEPYRYRRSRHLLFALPDGADGPGFLRAILPYVAHGATDLAPRPPWLCNVGITYLGLVRLGCPPALAAQLDSNFQEGPDPRTMGDMPGTESAGSRWWDKQFSTKQIHLTVQIYAREVEDIDAAGEIVLAAAKAAGVVELLPRAEPDYRGSRELDGAALPRAEGDVAPGAKLHFGYRDGLSHPDVDWDANDPSKLDRAHFLLGYSSAAISSAPFKEDAANFFRDSSYMIVRWLKQDVVRFERYLTEAAPLLAPERPLKEAREYVAAKLLGRWRDGTPLVLSPDKPDASLNSVSFDYKNDAAGLRCPFSAHIRVVNPAGQELTPGEVVGVPRVIRRGMPYGPEWPDTQVDDQGQVKDDEKERGIIGIFLCSSISRQFYTLMHWITQTNFSPVFDGKNAHGQDSLVGNRQFEGANPAWNVPGVSRPLPALPDFVSTRGTAFFLLPSMRVLQALAGVPAPVPSPDN